MQRFFNPSLLFLWLLLTGVTVVPALQHDRTTATKASVEQTARIREEWLGVYQDEEKVGSLHRRLIPVTNGYVWEEHWWLSLQLANKTHVTHTEVRAQANRTCELTAFFLWSSGGDTAFFIKADIANQGSSHQKIQGESISNGEVTSFSVPLSLPLHLPPLCQMATPIASRPGTHREFSVFNPLSLQMETVKLTMLGVETIAINGQQQVATKLASDMSDSRFYLWVDQEGRTLREEIAPGVILQRENQELGTVDMWKERAIIPPTSTTDFLNPSGEK